MQDYSCRRFGRARLQDAGAGRRRPWIKPATIVRNARRLASYKSRIWADIPSSVRITYFLLLLLALTASAGAETIPLPRPRPADAPQAPSACFLRLQEFAVVRSLPRINQPGGCVVDDVVQLDAVIISEERQVSFEPSATLRCEMAQAVSEWVRDEMAPKAAQLGSPLRAVGTADSYSCRGRNWVPGALLSEHGKANALDIRSLKLADGPAAQLTDPNIPKEFRDEMRKSACARFMTVLGPGADGHHEDHIHVDLQERRNDYRLCQWEVRRPIHRELPSAHIAGDGKPPQHLAPPSAPPVAVAVTEKPRSVLPPRRL